MGHCDTVGAAGPREAYQVFWADVGCENRGADDPPAEVSACKEVIIGGVSAPEDNPPGDGKNKTEVYTDCDPI